MYQKQRGATMWQWLFYGGIGVVVVYLGLNLTPIYLEGMSVKQALAKLENAGTKMSRREVTSKLLAQFNIDQVNRVGKDDIKFKSLRNGKMEVTIDYEAKVPLVGNLYIIAEFKNRAEI